MSKLVKLKFAGEDSLNAEILCNYKLSMAVVAAINIIIIIYGLLSWLQFKAVLYKISVKVSATFISGNLFLRVCIMLYML